MNAPRILVVEDDEDLAIEIRSTLESHGHEVIGFATSAKKALELAQRFEPTLALVDVQLGEAVDGVALAHELRKRPATAIVYITGRSDDETIARAKETSPVAYLLKPFDERSLVVTVELAIARQELEATLHGERERLRVTLESIGDAVIATGTDGRVTLLNPVAAALTGWSEAETLGKPLHTVFRIIDEFTREPREDPVARVLKTGTVIALANHTALIARDGTERSIADSGSPILDARKRIVGAVLVFRDITEQRRSELEMQRAQRLDAVGVLAGGLAHDFNNLLAVVTASVSFATRKLPPQERSVLGLLERALSACDRATSLTKQLLTFASGGAPVRRATALGDLVRSTVEFVLHGSSCRAVFDIASDLKIVDVDEGQIGQVLTNLVMNAVEAMPRGGIVRVAAANRSLEEGNPFMCAAGSYVEVAVADHGVGIAPEILERIFEPYFSTKQRGSGLGLATAYSIARRHGGALAVDSKPDTGSTFRLFVPAAAPGVSLPEVRRAEPVEPAPSGLRVLVMDDEDALRASLTSVLTELGYDVEGAPDGAEAVRLFVRAREAGKPFDGVLLDLTVRGGMGGLETVKQLLEIDPKTRAIATSGYAPDPILGYPERYGFVASLPKPFRLEELMTIMRRTTRRD